MALDRYNPPLTPPEYQIEQWNGSSWSPAGAPGLTSGDPSGVSRAPGSGARPWARTPSSPRWPLSSGAPREPGRRAGRDQSERAQRRLVHLVDDVHGGRLPVLRQPPQPFAQRPIFGQPGRTVERSVWSTASVPDANSSWGDGLATVDCFGPTSCVAGGWVYTASEGSSFSNQVLAWNGTSWALETAPAPSGASESQINSLACVANRACLAVGFSGRSTQSLTASVANNGYYEVGSDGGVFNFDVPFYGSEGGQHLNEPVVDMAATPTAGATGWWPATGGLQLRRRRLLRLDRGPSAQRADRGHGRHPRRGWLLAGGRRRRHLQLRRRRVLRLDRGPALNKPIVGMAATPDGRGYWLVAADGGIFSFGDAVFYGSTGGMPSTSRSWAWRPPPTAAATGWWPPTAGSSASATPSSTARRPVSP